MARSRRRSRMTGRFYMIIAVFAAVVVLLVVLLLKNRKSGQIVFGSLDANIEASAAIIRDETVVTTEKYEKVSFDVIEGETITNDTKVAEVFKRGYQDETMISLLNLQKEVLAYQLQMLGGNYSAELIDVNERIDTVETQIRDVSRGQSELDLLSLEQTLKELQSERSTMLRTAIVSDSNLSGLYAQLDAQQETLNSWKRDIINTAGTGIVSFYFDGYEQVLNVNKLSTINAALVSSVVKGGNTSNTTESGSDTPLYRLINNTHWFIAFVTDSSNATRVSSGEEYYVSFPDYSDQTYQAVARDAVVSEKKVVNILEFNVDIGKLVGIRTVNATISKAAQGLVVPLDAITVVEGIPGINVSYADTVLRVEVEVLADDGKKAIIKTRNATDTLTQGMKYIKP